MSTKTITKIAKSVLRIKSLETRGRDGFDLYIGEDGRIAVWELREALKQAYAAGVADGIRSVHDEQNKELP